MATRAFCHDIVISGQYLRQYCNDVVLHVCTGCLYCLNHILSQVRYVADRLSDTTTQSEYDLQQTNQCYWSLDDDIEGIFDLGNADQE
jgi:hypothetical protein